MDNTNIEPKLFEVVEALFDEHLALNNNNRIIFSGKFGHGKTTFLKHYFNDVNKGKYSPIFLYPVNYSVASNEDIFEYINYDIIIDMLQRDNTYTFKHIDINFWQSISFSLHEKPQNLISAIINMIPKIGDTDISISTIAKSIALLNTSLTDSYKTHKKQLSDIEKIKDLFKDIEESSEGIYSNTAITKLIYNALSNTKSNSENILIIDDLDRIDPEHIFRILNVFAAHFDKNNQSPNKFGFDKVILVCDIENIRNIFKAKYGANTDFNGYIDKFYSHRIFGYDIKDIMVSYFRNIIHNAPLRTSAASIDSQSEKYYKSILLGDNNFLYDILALLVDCGEVDMRNIVKWNNTYTTFNYDTKVGKHKLDGDFQIILLSIKLLSEIKGGYGSLKAAIQSISLLSPLRYTYKTHANNLAYIYLYDEHHNRYDSSINGRNIEFKLRDTKVQFNMIERDGHKNHNIQGGLTSITISKDDFIFLFTCVIDMIESKKISFV